MKQKTYIIAYLIIGLLIISCNAATRLLVPTSTLTPIPSPEAIDTATPLAPSVALLPSTTNYQNTSLGISLDYPATWHLQDEIPDQPLTVQLTTFDPASPPHKLEWDSQTVSINIHIIPQENATQDLNTWAESAKQAAIASHLDVFLDERIELAHGVQAARLTLVSGSGGIIDQVLMILDGRSYEFIIQGNFELARTVLDTLQPIPALKPPDSDTPASGICPQFDGEIVEITINDPPPPSPRCVQVTAEQRLKIINATSNPVRVKLAHFDVEIPPAGETIFDQNVGDYLAPGVHLMLNGAEIWLLETPDSPTSQGSPPTHNQYYNQALGYSITYPTEWIMNDYSESQPSQEMILNPPNAEPFITYLSILLDSRTLDDIQMSYAGNTPDAQRSEVVFAGQAGIQYTYSWGRIEIFIPYQGRVYSISTDKPNNAEVQRILNSFTFQK